MFKPEGWNDHHLLFENISAWEVFLACRTQWRRASDGMYDSLDYSALLPVMSLFNLENPLEVLERVQLIELGAKNRFREQRQIENQRHA